MKRNSGVWGDDVELQALSEIYDRPIEIYSGGNKPLKTFHENKKEFNRKKKKSKNINININDQFIFNKDDKDNDNKFEISPIRISYHGKSHYNSVVPTKFNNDDIWNSYKSSILTSFPDIKSMPAKELILPLTVIAACANSIGLFASPLIK